MATLIVYPDEGFNTYVPLAEAQAIASNYLIGSSFLQLTDEEQSLYLLQAFRIINSLTGFTGPTPPEDVGCLPVAQTEVALQDSHFNISMSMPNEPQIASQSAGPVSISYFEQAQSLGVDLIPLSAYDCLTSYGAVIAMNSPIGSFRKVR